MRLHQRIEWKDINKKGKDRAELPPIVKRSGIVIVSESMITTFINIKPKKTSGYGQRPIAGRRTQEKQPAE